MNASHYEQQLTEADVKDRIGQLGKLFRDQEKIGAQVDGYHRDLRAARRQLRELDGRVRTVQQEISSGVALIPRQQTMPDPPLAPEQLPARECGECGAIHRIGENTLCAGWRPADGAEPKASTFTDMYPAARTHERLRADLSVVLSNRGLPTPSLEALKPWHPDTGIFQGIANWARVILAHMSGERARQAGILLPGVEPMPEPLAKLLGVQMPPTPKKTRAAKVYTGTKTSKPRTKKAR